VREISFSVTGSVTWTDVSNLTKVLKQYEIYTVMLELILVQRKVLTVKSFVSRLLRN